MLVDRNGALYSALRATYRRLRVVRERHSRDPVFIHINKTAGTSVVRALRLHAEGHRTAIEKKQELGEACWRRKFSFAFVRNPWDRLVSQYHYRVAVDKSGLRSRPIEFCAWVQQVFEEGNPAYRDEPLMFVPQLDWICDEAGNVIVSFVGRFETLEQDLQSVCRRLGRTAVLPHLNPSSHNAYHEYYDADTAEIVRRHFAKDIAHFGYEF